MGARVEGLLLPGSFTLFCLVLLPSNVLANWMYLGMISSVAMNPSTDGGSCNKVPGLDFMQQEVCKKTPDAIPCVRNGARKSIYECYYQFRYERWNCTTNRNESVFGDVLYKGTKETAFVYAVTSAGVVHAITKSCSAGNLTDCSCDLAREGQKTVEGWKWGGCSDNINYGIRFGKKFLDVPEEKKYALTRSAKSMMNLHNNKAGREAVAKHMELKCRCHGISGSCEVRTCWKSMPSFRLVGEYLKRKYENSVQVALRRKNDELRRRQKLRRKQAIPEDELVHIHRSPNYCRRDPRKGILGTSGRQCNKNTRGPDSCDMLCCGRGYNTRVERHIRRCHCKFVYCCRVECKTCETMVDIHTCK